MRVMYSTNVKIEGEEVKIEKIIETNAISFFPEMREVQVGDRHYILGDEDNFGEMQAVALRDGFINVTDLDYRFEERKQYNPRPQNYKPYNKRGGYSRRRY